MDGLIHAYHTPKSAAQQRYMQERVAQQRRQRLLQAQQQQQQDLLIPNPSPLERTLSGSSLSTIRPQLPHTPSDDNSKSQDELQYSDPVVEEKKKKNNNGQMEPYQRLPTASSGSSSQHSQDAHQNLLTHPFEIRHGRRYLRELPYPLPVDLLELQRQNLRTLLACNVFGRAVCSPHATKNPPKRVLELACGSAYWSALCHDYFASHGHTDIAFTGLDVAPLAPDLRKQGLNWTFVQHDLRRIPYPFDNATFDLVMLKDLSLILPLGFPSQKLLDESIRILAPGGTLEIWETDSLIRTLLPHPPNPSKSPLDHDAAARSATFLISPGTPFAPTQNPYLHQANAWIQESLDRRRLPPTPCTRAQGTLVEDDRLHLFGSRRVAVPLGGEMRWERQNPRHVRHPSDRADSVMNVTDGGKGKRAERGLTPDQAALRSTALATMVQMIGALEPLLKEASGKNAEEWGYWWGGLMGELGEGEGLSGECLELGAWWGLKCEEEEEG